MAVVANKRSVMTLYSGPLCPYSHRVRIVLAEKGVTYDLLEINDETQSDALVEINPYGSVPTLVDRDLVLYQADIIMEYLDERFPHPPLMPVYPVARATSRLYLHRVNHEWYSKINILLDKKEIINYASR
jgi:RNA polymerase-associated protein